MTALLVALAGAAGVLARYGVGQALGPGAAPWSVLAVNVAGSLALGLLVGAGAGEQARAIVGIGLLGGFTTFSTFSLDPTTRSLALPGGARADLDAGRPGRALAYAAASLVLGVAAAGAGFVLARRG